MIFNQIWSTVTSSVRACIECIRMEKHTHKAPIEKPTTALIFWHFWVLYASITFRDVRSIRQFRAYNLGVCAQVRMSVLNQDQYAWCDDFDKCVDWLMMRKQLRQTMLQRISTQKRADFLQSILLFIYFEDRLTDTRSQRKSKQQHTWKYENALTSQATLLSIGSFVHLIGYGPNWNPRCNVTFA